MQLRLGLGLAVVVAAGGFLLLWETQRSRDAPVVTPEAAAEESTTMTKAATAPKLPVLPPRQPRETAHALPTAESLVVPRVRLSDESEDEYQTRMKWVELYDEWIRRAGVTPDQEAKLLQRIADAQVNYEAAEIAAMDLANERSRLRNARMTPDQKKRARDASMARTLAEISHDPKVDELQAQARAVFAEVNTALEPGTTQEELDVTEDWHRVVDGEDLLDDTLAGLSDVLTERQLESFRTWWENGPFASLLHVRLVRSKNDLALARTQ